MAYDETAAERVRRAVASHEGLSERKMFGGLCLMLHGNMFAGLIGDELMLRVGPAHFEALLARPFTRPMDFTGRTMHGFVYVGREGYAAEADLADWLEEALSYVESLPPKQPGAPRRRPKR
jgi:TfoX/Sxy family transcriptional regulator of competence genes